MGTEKRQRVGLLHWSSGEEGGRRSFSPSCGLYKSLQHVKRGKEGTDRGIITVCFALRLLEGICVVDVEFDLVVLRVPKLEHP